LGSQPRRSGSRRGSRKGKVGIGTGGGRRGEDERKHEKEVRQRKRIYQKATERLVNALKAKDFSYAADVATSITISKAPVQEIVSLFVAGARAFSEGKSRGWKPKPPELASNGIRYAQEKTGYELTPERRQFLSSILATNLRRIGEKHGRK